MIESISFLALEKIPHAYPAPKCGSRVFITKKGDYTVWAKLMFAIADEPGHFGDHYRNVLWNCPPRSGCNNSIFAFLVAEGFVVYHGRGKNKDKIGWHTGPKYPFK